MDTPFYYCSFILQCAYIFVFRLHEDEVYKYAKHLADITGYKVISIEVAFKGMPGASQKHFAGVEMFLNYLCYATHVVTDSFHATALSLIFNRNVHPVLKKTGTAMNERIVSLMDMVEERKCIVNESLLTSSTITEIDYEMVNPIIARERNAALDYLKTIVR